MRVRKRCLPPGWYPATAEESRREVEAMLAATSPPEAGARPPAATARAGIIPHAGWHFSGRLALEVL